MDKLFKLYKSMLDIHIQTKTIDKVFHEATADFYELLFSLFHEISEKRQDIEMDKPANCEEAKNEAYDLLEKAKIELEELINEENTFWMDNLLRGLYDKLEFACWTARGFLPRMEDEKDDTGDVTEMEEPEEVDREEENTQEI